MDPLVNAQCSICGCRFHENDDLLTTECGHTCHRACAEDHHANRSNINCRVCGKESALDEELDRNKIKKGILCSICKNPLDPKDDLVTTACDRTYHRMCAQDGRNNTQKTNCHICGKESALGEALDQDATTTETQYSICGKPLDPKSNLVTTACGHPCHRTCAECRLNTRHRRDCRVCHKDLVYDEVLDQDKMSRRSIIIRQSYPDQLQSDKNVSYSYRADRK
jgi:hypothetical protein